MVQVSIPEEHLAPVTEDIHKTPDYLLILSDVCF